ncbi:MAG: hypothetical protein WDA24_03495 [Tissierellales bacterium]
MNLLGYILMILGTVYGLLNLIAGLTQIKQKKIDTWSSIVIIVGGVLIAISVIFSSKGSYFFYLLLLGLIIIHIATIRNGIKMFGKLNWKHHIVRFLISLTLVILSIIR